MHSKALRRALASVAALCAAPFAMSQTQRSTPAGRGRRTRRSRGQRIPRRASAERASRVKTQFRARGRRDFRRRHRRAARRDASPSRWCACPASTARRDRGNQSQADDARTRTSPGAGPGQRPRSGILRAEPECPLGNLSVGRCLGRGCLQVAVGGSRSRAASPAPSTSRPSGRSTTPGPNCLVRGGGRCITKPAAIFLTTTRMGYRGSGSFTHVGRRQLRFQPRRQRAAPEERVPVIPGLGLQRRQPSTHGNATGDLDGDGAPNPTPWGAQTEVKKLTEDRFGVNGAIGWRVGDNFGAERRCAVLEVHHRRRPEPGPVRPQRHHRQLGQRQRRLLQRSALSDYDARGRDRWSARHARQQLLRLGHQRDREVQPKTRICSSPAPTPSGELEHWTHQRRSVAFGSRRAPIAGRHSVPRFIAASLTLRT